MGVIVFFAFDGGVFLWILILCGRVFFVGAAGWGWCWLARVSVCWRRLLSSCIIRRVIFCIILFLFVVRLFVLFVFFCCSRVGIRVCSRIFLTGSIIRGSRFCRIRRGSSFCCLLTRSLRIISVFTTRLSRATGCSRTLRLTVWRLCSCGRSFFDGARGF